MPPKSWPLRLGALGSWLLRAAADDLDGTLYFYHEPAVHSVEEFNGRASWFANPHQTHLIVVDDFLPEQLLTEFQQAALSLPFAQYFPECNPGDSGCEPWGWNASALCRFKGKKLEPPFHGKAYRDEDSFIPWLQALIGPQEVIKRDTWPEKGDCWNGALHLMNARFSGGAVHHHFKEGDLNHGWSGLVYLSDDIPQHSGTSFWLKRATGKVVGNYGIDFTFHPPDDFDLAYVAAARRNRLVLFRESIYHRVEGGYGTPSGPRSAMRLTQTFFFETLPAEGGGPRSEL